MAPNLTDPPRSSRPPAVAGVNDDGWAIQAVRQALHNKIRNP